MAAIDNVRATQVLQGMLGLVTFPASATAPMWVRLMTANGSTNVTGSQFGNGSGYATSGLSGYFSAVTTAGGNGPTSTGMTAAAACPGRRRVAAPG